MVKPWGTSLGVYWGTLRCKALHKECSGRFSFDRKVLEWAEARMTESLLL
jgi:hypothetical protein